MSNLVEYQHTEFGTIRTLEKDGEPWFVAKDVCDALDYSDTAQAMRTLDPDEYHTLQNMQGITNSRNGIVNIINESGLYSLILRSRKPEAKNFKKWITSEVLPSIRKHGFYGTEDTIDKMLNDPDSAIRMLEKFKEERTKRLEAEARQEQAEEDRKRLIHSKRTYSTTELAKEMGIRSAQRLNMMLKCSDSQTSFYFDL